MAQEAWSLSPSRIIAASNKEISEGFTYVRRYSSSLPSMPIWKATQKIISKISLESNTKTSVNSY